MYNVFFFEHLISSTITSYVEDFASFSSSSTTVPAYESARPFYRRLFSVSAHSHIKKPEYQCGSEGISRCGPDMMILVMQV